MRISAIEIGTNSTKFIIQETNEANAFKVIEKTSTVNRLSSNMYDNNKISEEAMEKGISVIGEYLNRSKLMDAHLISVFSTSVLRDASNREEFIKRVRNIYGICVDVITGEREAYLSYKGCCSLFRDYKNSFAVIDIGGGSTEIITGSKSSVNGKYSINVGAVRLTQMFLEKKSSKRDDTEDISDYVIKSLEEAGVPELGKSMVVGTGGTVKSIGTIIKKKHYKDEEAIHGMRLGINDVEHIYKALYSMSSEEKMHLEGLNPRRGDVIVAGVTILLAIMKRYRILHITISSRGVLEGLLEDPLWSCARKEG